MGTPSILTKDALAAFFACIPDAGTVLELGSGRSTGSILANGNRVVTMEHNPVYMNQCKGAEYVYAPLVGDFYCPKAMNAAIALAKRDHDLVGVIVDGPPKKQGAKRIRFAEYLSRFSGIPLLIDDTNRASERRLMRASKRNGWFTYKYGITGGKKWNLMLKRR